MPKNSHLIVNSLIRKNTSLIFTISLSSILALSGFSIILDDSSAQMVVPIGDFFCWDFTGPQQESTPLLGLTDQIISEPFNSFTPVEFCESSDKDLDNNGSVDFASPFTTTGQHYTTYTISGAPVNQQVTITINNFDPPYSEPVNVIEPVELWVPNTKCISPTLPSCTQVVSEDPNRHFICYTITGGPSIIEPEMKFIHQFGSNVFTIDKPILLCNPVDKDQGDDGSIDFPIISETTHVVCFDLKPTPTGTIPSIERLDDQISTVFNPTGTPPTLIGLDYDKACFQATKTLGELSGTAMFINGAALLVAGSQMIAAWIVPFVVAAVGIGLVLARKY